MASTFNQDRFTPLQNASEIYSDFMTDFLDHPNNHDIVRKTNEASVKQALLNLIQTNKYERPFQPTFGSNLRKYLFEPMSPLTAHNIQDEITACIESYEPRVRLISVVASPYIDNNAYAVTIVFYVINISTPVTLQTFLYRVR